MTRRRTRLAAYLVSINDDRVLLARIAPGYPGAGSWTLPGGGVDWGEHPEDALVREVYEEAGLRLTEYEFIGIDSRVFAESEDRPAMHTVRLLYTATMLGTPRVTEVDGSVDAAAWVPLKNLPNVPHVQLVRTALERVGASSG